MHHRRLMSSIEKLLIRGIRSFDPDQPAVIEFFSPVTLIVGHNGAGKTTVIEALKYATTGDQPPGAKGGAFVHDPKLVAGGGGEVKAQVKLKFRNVRGQSMVVTRSLQSMVKKGKIEQKTLEGLLVTTDPVTGEQVSVSSRCAELDAEIPVQLGVSRAVLESVIFCHQEDSQWPLSEPAVLKKRFDDLFAATRYTKALDVLKAVKKELTAEGKLEEQRLDFLKADREKALRLQALISSSQRQQEECRGKIEKYDLEIGTVQQQLECIDHTLLELSGLQAELERTEHDQATALQSIRDLESTTTDLKESEAQLQAMLERQQRVMADSAGEAARIEEARGRSMAEIEAKQRYLNALLAERGAAQSLVEELCRKRGLRQEALDVVRRLFNSQLLEPETASQALDSCKRALSAAKASVEQSLLEMSQKINGITLEKNTLEEGKRLRRRAMDDCRQKLLDTLQKLEESEASRQQIDDLQQRVADEELTVQRCSELLAAGNYDARLADLEKRKRDLDSKGRRLNQRIAELSLQADVWAKLDLKRTERSKRDEQLQRLLLDLKSDLQFVVAGAEDVDKEVDKVVKSKERQTKVLQEQLDSLIVRESTASEKCSYTLKVLEQREQELQDKVASVDRVIGPGNSLSVVLSDAEKEYQGLRESTVSVVEVHKGFLQKLQSTHDCPLCARPFESKLDEEALAGRLKRLASGLPSSAEEASPLLKDLGSRLNDLRRLVPIEEAIHELKNALLPELRLERQRLLEERQLSEASVQDTRSELSHALLEEKRAQSAKRKADEASRLYREIKALSEDISYLERVVSDTEKESISDIQQMLKALDDELRIATMDHERLQSESKAKQQDLSMKSDRFRDLREELLQLQLRAGEKTALFQSKSDLQRQLESSEDELSMVDLRIKDLCQQIEALRASSEAETERLKRGLDAKESEYEERRLGVQALVAILADVEKLQGLDPEQRVETVDRQARAAEKELEGIHSTLLAFDKELSAVRASASEHEARQRQVRDCLRLYELKRRSSGHMAKIASIGLQLRGFDRTSALLDKQRCQLKLSDLMGDRSGLTGELRQLEEHCTRMTRELDTDYPSIDNRYKSQFIKCQTSSMAGTDIDRYSRALDAAIMRYHAAKMDEVNRTLKDLWTAVYTGTDIDSVEIRADQESASGQRSYNYRVVMVKNGVELDMRGRSSAGQRVLTSLLIRLALADTFAAHCGVLALDEPTTNLDRENITALAEALAELIRSRRSAANFQLLVITHDEEFVEALARHECAEYYYRIGRDSRQHSVIERQSLSSF